MRTGITITVSAADRRRLEAIVADRNAPAEACLARADRPSERRRASARPAIMAATGKSKTTRLALAGAVHGGGRRRAACATRPARRARRRSPTNGSREVVRLTHEPPPHEATHWTARAMAEGGRAGGLDGAEDLEGPRPRAASLARASSCPTIPPSPRSSTTSSGSMSPAGPCRGAQRRREVARSRRSTAPSPACR